MKKMMLMVISMTLLLANTQSQNITWDYTNLIQNGDFNLPGGTNGAGLYWDASWISDTAYILDDVQYVKSINVTCSEIKLSQNMLYGDGTNSKWYKLSFDIENDVPILVSAWISSNTGNGWTTIPPCGYMNHREVIFKQAAVTAIMFNGPTAESGTMKITNVVLVTEGGWVGFKEKKDEVLIIYPNPAVNCININVDKEMEIKVFNLEGKSILGRTVLSGNNIIDTSFFPAGVYFITTPKGSYKFIKQ